MELNMAVSNGVASTPEDRNENVHEGATQIGEFRGARNGPSALSRTHLEKGLALDVVRAGLTRGRERGERGEEREGGVRLKHRNRKWR